MKMIKQEDFYCDEYSSNSSSDNENDSIDDDNCRRPKRTHVDRGKRLKASARERRRRHVLNDALERLRRKVPSVGSRSSKLSKIEVLRMAIDYIGMLSYHASSSPNQTNLHYTQQDDQHNQQIEQYHQQIMFNNNNNNNNNNNLMTYQTDVYPQQHAWQQQQSPMMNDMNQMLELQHLQQLTHLDEFVHHTSYPPSM